MAGDSWTKRLKSHFGGKSGKPLKPEATASSDGTSVTIDPTATKVSHVEGDLNPRFMGESSQPKELINAGNKTSNERLIPIQLDPQPYNYRSLATETSVRLLNLHPGKGEASIIVSLKHGSLEDLPFCEALSYQWGAPKGIFPILCDNGEGKTFTKLLVTPNLLSALKRLRLPKLPRLLWIDALCINQEDRAERSQQVPLMRDIYTKTKRVLIWIGEENKLTPDAFKVMRQLSDDLSILEPKNDCSSILSGIGPYAKFPNPRREQQLQALRTSEIWPHLLDLLNGREYFSRLWIVQEVVLAAQALVMCGGHEIDWNHFCRAACVMIAYKPFTQGLSSLKILVRVGNLRSTQYQFRNSPGGEVLSLGELLVSFGSSEVSDPVDRVFGILGLVQLHKQTQRFKPDYSKIPESVFAVATGLAILHEQRFIPWLFIRAEPSARKGKSMPSWAPYLDGADGSFTLPVQTWLMSVLTCSEKITLGDAVISEDVIPADGTINGPRIQLGVWGFILDSVVSVNENFSARNIEEISFSNIDNIATSEAYPTYAHVTSALWQTLISFNEDNNQDKSEEDFWKAKFLAFANTLDCAVLGLTPEVYTRNPQLQTLTQDHPALLKRFPGEVSQNMKVQALVTRHEFLRKGHAHARDFGTGIEYKMRIQQKMCSDELGLGRNMFKGRKGYMGVGPGGANGDGVARSAVQVGDVIAIIHRAMTPVILRKAGSDLYTFVGPAYVGCLKKSSCFTPARLPGSAQQFRLV